MKNFEVLPSEVPPKTPVCSSSPPASHRDLCSPCPQPLTHTEDRGNSPAQQQRAGAGLVGQGMQACAAHICGVLRGGRRGGGKCPCYLCSRHPGSPQCVVSVVCSLGPTTSVVVAPCHFEVGQPWPKQRFQDYGVRLIEKSPKEPSEYFSMEAASSCFSGILWSQSKSQQQDYLVCWNKQVPKLLDNEEIAHRTDCLNYPISSQCGKFLMHQKSASALMFRHLKHCFKLKYFEHPP